MTPLEQEIGRRIRQAGPIRVDEYMALALGHPEYGYYRTRDPLGGTGDFTTAPEISQVFGELIGLWCAVMWEHLGRPAPFAWTELGPGRGTLMADAVRAGRMVEGFLDAARIVLLETSPVLRERQKAALEGVPVVHVEQPAEIPRLPLIAVANEFFDALPIRQIVRRGGTWRERRLDLDAGTGSLRFVEGEETELPPGTSLLVGAAEEGDVFEFSPAGEILIAGLAARIVENGGAALVVDYGHRRRAVGETLQAVRAHRFHDPLREPGEADLTAHVDFAALSDAAAGSGASVYGPILQKDFLLRLGIEPRTTSLAAGATPDQAILLRSATRRLIDPAAMGRLFKVLALTSGDSPPPGFQGSEKAS